MTGKEKHLQDLSEIRNLMENSVKFLSLSGLSGVCAGIFALVGAGLIYFNVGVSGTRDVMMSYAEIMTGKTDNPIIWSNLFRMLIIGASVLILSLISGYYFTARKAKKEGLEVFGRTALRMLLSLMVPLATGGAFSLILLLHHDQYLIAPATLVFYGLALLNCSKYTVRDIKYLGISEIILGLLSAVWIGKGLLFWALGFGVLHVLYGSLMYFKYEYRKA